MASRRSGEQGRIGLHRGTGRAAQPGQLELIECGHQRLGADGGQTCGDGPVGADLRGRRGEQLGEVGGQQLIGRRQLAEPEVDDPGVAVVGQEDVGEPQVAMGDAVGAHQRQLRPHAGHHLVGHLRGLDAVQGTTRDGLVREHEAVGLRGGECREPRRADADVAGRQRDERFVLDGPAQRGERLLVTEIARLEAAVDAEHQVGAALVVAERLDEQRGPVAAGREVRAWSREHRGSPAPTAPGARRPRPARRRSTRRSGGGRGRRPGRWRRRPPSTPRARPRSCRTRSARRGSG